MFDTVFKGIMKNQKKEISDKEYLLVKRIAYKIYNKYCLTGQNKQFTKHDLYHFGIVGLLDAAQRFNEEYKVPWLAFAHKRIRGEIIDNIRKMPLLRIPQAMYKEISLLKEKKLEFKENGRELISKELALELKWDLKKLHKIEKISINKIISMDAKNINGDSNEFSLSNQLDLIDLKQSTVKKFDLEKIENPESDFIKKELFEIVQKCLKTIKDPEERLVLVSRILKEMKLKQVAVILDRSIETVRQKQISALESMKVCLAKNGWNSEAC